jgi:hypothetical protein
VVNEVKSGLTDDRGEYRMWDLAEGAYYVKTGGRRGGSWYVGLLPQVPDADVAYDVVYYPGVATREAAQALPLHPGETARADFVAPEVRAYRIFGEIKGAPAAYLPTMRLLRGDEVMGNRLTRNRANGTFCLFDVPPGSYTLQAYSNNPDRMGETAVTVGSADQTGVTIVISPAAKVEGDLVWTAAADPKQRFRPMIQFVPKAPGRIPTTTPKFTPVTPEGHFTAELLPGVYELQLVAGGFYVDSIQSGSTDVLSDGLTVTEAGVSDLRVTLAKGGGKIEGTFANLPSPKTTEPTDEDQGVVMIALLAVRKHGSALIPVLNLVPPGHFQVQGLAPGDYTLYAWQGRQEIEYRNPAVLQTMSSGAVSAHVREGETEQVNMTVIPLPKEKP